MTEFVDRAEMLISNALIQIKSDIGENDLNLIKKFIENNEFEVALHWIISVIEEEKLPVEKELLNEMRVLHSSICE